MGTRHLLSAALLSLGASGCLKLQQTTRVREDVRIERSDEVEARGRLRVQATPAEDGRALRLDVDRHDVCAENEYRVVTRVEEKSTGAKPLLYLGGLAGLGGGLILLHRARDWSDDPSSDEDYVEGQGCPNSDGTETADKHCVTSQESGYILGGVITGLGAWLMLEGLASSARDGLVSRSAPERQLVRREATDCDVRPVDGAAVTLLDPRGRKLDEGLVGDGSVTLSLRDARLDDQNGQFRLELAERAGASESVAVVLDPNDWRAVHATLQMDARLRAPPRLVGTLTFDDAAGNGDRALDAEESGVLLVKVVNEGRGPARDVTLQLRPPEDIAPHLTATWRQTVGDLAPNDLRLVRVPVRAGDGLPGGEHTFEAALLEEGDGFDSPPFRLRLATAAMRAPRLEIARFDVRDDGSGVSQGNGNGRIEPNELVEVRLVVANRGRGAARGVTVALESGDRYVRPTTEPVALGALAPGEERRVALGFVVARRYQGDAALPLQVQLGEERARFRARGDLRFVLNRTVDGTSVVDLTGAAPTAGEERRVAVLELRNQAAVPPDAAAYLTDLIRRAAVASLTRPRYFVMTRENILEQLPPGVTDLAACLGDCEVETGRNVGADFVVSGEILAFGAGLRVTIKLHDTTSGALVATETAAGADLGAVEEDVTRAASTAFAGIR